MPPKIGFLHGGLGGRDGNTRAVAQTLINWLQSKAEIREIFLTETHCDVDLTTTLQECDGFVFTTGTYWDSWGSPMQRFLEETTQLETSNIWCGKPAAVLVTMHSVGGKEVLSRLQGVLCTLGLSLPPMSGVAYSLTGHLALQVPDNPWRDDFYTLEDLHTVGHNLLEAATGGRNWQAWPVDPKDPRRRWF